MDDAGIVELYWQRSERAIEETDKKYGPYCQHIAYSILHDSRDAEECVDDTYLGAWNTMPDKRPERLSPYLGRIARNLAINRLAARTARRRGGGEAALCLEELGDCVPAGFSVEQELEARELARTLGRFISALPTAERRVFLSRYFHLLSVEETARRLGYSQSKVKTMLYRTRRKLLNALREEERE